MGAMLSCGILSHSSWTAANSCASCSGAVVTHDWSWSQPIIDRSSDSVSRTQSAYCGGMTAEGSACKGPIARSLRWIESGCILYCGVCCYFIQLYVHRVAWENHPFISTPVVYYLIVIRHRFSDARKKRWETHHFYFQLNRHTWLPRQHLSTENFL